MGVGSDVARNTCFELVAGCAEELNGAEGGEERQSGLETTRTTTSKSFIEQAAHMETQMQCPEDPVQKKNQDGTWDSVSERSSAPRMLAGRSLSTGKAIVLPSGHVAV